MLDPSLTCQPNDLILLAPQLCSHPEPSPPIARFSAVAAGPPWQVSGLQLWPRLCWPCPGSRARSPHPSGRGTSWILMPEGWGKQGLCLIWALFDLLDSLLLIPTQVVIRKKSGKGTCRSRAGEQQGSHLPLPGGPSFLHARLGLQDDSARPQCCHATLQAVASQAPGEVPAWDK